MTRSSKRTSGPTSFSPTSVVERFVLRARRVAAHSLAESADQLRKQSRSMFSGTIDLAGNLTLREDLPEEEAFESLVARLRPLTVETESIFYETVLDAIITLLGDAATDEERHRLEHLRRQWQATEIQGTQVQGYTVQTVHREMGATPPVSDTQLAAGWLYADLVHADARGPKAESLQFSLKDRFTAAVRVFSRVTVLTLETLDLVRELYDRSRLSLSAEPWSEEVTVAESGAPYDVRGFHADIGTPAPGIETPMANASSDWTPFSVSDLLRQDPANQVAVTLHTDGGADVIDAVVLERRSDATITHWDVLVDGCAVFTFTFTLDDGKATSCTLTTQKYLDLKNSLKLKSTQFARRLREAQRAEFTLPGGGSVTMSMRSLNAADDLQLRVLEEALGDVITIETITQQEIPTCNGPFDDLDRIRLRQTRLLWEGRLVHTRLPEVTVTSPNGRPPKYIAIPATSITFAGQSIPTPLTYATHPQLETIPTGPDIEAGQARDFIARPPDDEYLVAWSPDRLIRTDVEPEPAPWGLVGIDEDSF